MGAIRKAFKVKNAVRHPIHTATRPVRRTVRKAVVPKSVRTASYKVRSVSTAVHNPISTAIRSLDSDNLKKRKAGTSATKSTYSRAPYKRSTKNTTRNGSSYSYSGGSSFDYDESYVTDSEGTSPVIYENKQSSIGSRIIDGLIEALAPWLLLFGVPFLFWLVIMPFTFLPGGAITTNTSRPLWNHHSTSLVQVMSMQKNKLQAIALAIPHYYETTGEMPVLRLV